MWFLVWFQFVNNTLDHYVLGQYPNIAVCAKEKERSLVLVNKRTTAVYCFEVIPE